MNAEQIAKELRQEAIRYMEIADLLDPPNGVDELDAEAEQFYAPYGYKADGTPRRRPPLSSEAQAKASATRATRRAAKARAQGPVRKREEVRLNVLSSTHPTEAELADREVVHTTEEPA